MAVRSGSFIPGHHRSVRSGSRRKSLKFAAAWTLIALTAFLARPSAAEDKSLTFGIPCEGPASTPDCASLTWNACGRYRDPRLCDLVGFRGMKFWEGDMYNPGVVNVEQKPRSTPSPTVRGRTDGVRRVGPERFRRGLEAADAFKVPAHMIGTHEVTYRLHVCEKGPCSARGSEFYRKEGDRWVIVSWTDNTLSCEGWTPDGEPDCAIFIPFLDTWEP